MLDLVPRGTVLVLSLALLQWLLAGTYADGNGKGHLVAQLPEQPVPRIIRVGPENSVKTIAAAARMATDNDTIEIEGGEYRGEAAVAVWTQNNLTIRGVHGRPVLVAAGEVAEGKGIWIIRGNNIVIENIAFSGARAAERNGAGVKLERGQLTVRRCAFIDNENGMLVGNDPTIILEIVDSEFASNGANDGYSHNLYVGSIRRLTVQGSYFHHAKLGHLLKTRAEENFIRYNRITDEVDGRASYELDFPFGGVAFVLGNLVQQGERTENSTIISFGAEGYKWSRNELYLSYNTIVNDRPDGGIFIKAYPGSAYVKTANNIYVGKGNIDIQSKADIGENWKLGFSAFEDPARFDFRLKVSSPANTPIIAPEAETKEFLRPTQEYTYPVGTSPISPIGSLKPGAFQSAVKR